MVSDGEEGITLQNALMCVDILGLLGCAGVSTVWLTRLLSLMHPGRVVPEEWRFQALASCAMMARSAVTSTRSPYPTHYFSFSRLSVLDLLPPPHRAQGSGGPGGRGGGSLEADPAGLGPPPESCLELRNVAWPFSKEYLFWAWVRVRAFPATTDPRSPRQCVLSVSLESDGRVFEVFVSPRMVVLRMEQARGGEAELEAVNDRIVPGQWFSLAVHHTR